MILKGVFDLDAITEFEQLVHDTAKSWATKAGMSEGFDDIYACLAYLEANDKTAFYKLSSSLGTSVAGMRLAMSDGLVQGLGELMQRPSQRFFCNNPTVFYNAANVTRLQYLWHQESTYQTDYATAVHTWFPLFRNVREEDGPMLVKRGAFHGTFPYSYEKRQQGFTQLYIQEDDIADYETVPCTLDRGDAVVFNHNLVHCTGKNVSGKARVNMIVRYFDALDEQEFEPVLTYHSRVAHLNANS